LNELLANQSKQTTGKAGKTEKKNNETLATVVTQNKESAEVQSNQEEMKKQQHDIETNTEKINGKKETVKQPQTTVEEIVHPQTAASEPKATEVQPFGTEREMQLEPNENLFSKVKQPQTDVTLRNIEKSFQNTSQAVLSSIRKLRRAHGEALLHEIAQMYGLKIQVLEDDNKVDPTSENASLVFAPSNSLKPEDANPKKRKNENQLPRELRQVRKKRTKGSVF